MTDYHLNSTPKEDPVPLSPMPQMAQVPLSPMPQMAQVPLSSRSQIPLGPEPCTVTCPSCGASILTTVKLQSTTHTHLMAFLLCLICVCCACIPYFVDSCQSAEHYCPNCDAYLGTHKR